MSDKKTANEQQIVEDLIDFIDAYIEQNVDDTDDLNVRDDDIYAHVNAIARVIVNARFQTQGARQ
jgi:hypothetical protein